MKIIPQQAVANTTDFTRASTATYFDKNGVLQTAAVNEPRFNYDPVTLEFDRMLVEEQKTNRLRNNSMIGAVVGSPGTFPTRWGSFNGVAGTVTYQIVATGVQDGIPYIDLRWYGTAGSSGAIYNYLEQTTACAAAIGDIFNISAYVQLINGSLSNISSIFLDIAEYTAAFGYVRESVSSNLVLNNSSSRLSASRKDADLNVLGGTTAWVTPNIRLTVTAAAPIDLTLRIGMPQVTNGAGVSSVIPTTTVAVTRAADVLPVMTSNVLENDYAAWSVGTTYALDDRVTVITPSSHKIYNSLQAGNLGNTPVGGADDLFWELVGDTNRWKMFDGYVSSQTLADAGSDLIATVIKATGFVDSVSVNNIDAASIRIMQVDATVGTVYDQTTNLVSDSGITDYWEYFFSPVERVANFNATDLLLYSDCQIHVTLFDEGGQAKCGACVIGLSVDFGDADYGLSLGIRDYSVNTEDDFGNITILKRGYRDIMSLTVMVPNTSLATFKKLLAGLRSTPAVFVGADIYGDATTVFGYYESWGKVIEYPNHTMLSLSVKGLI